MQAAAEAAGMAFVFNPVTMQSLSMPAVEEQADAIDGRRREAAWWPTARRAPAPSILWALAMAGRMPVDDILAATAKAGYPARRVAPAAQVAGARRMTGDGPSSEGARRGADPARRWHDMGGDLAGPVPDAYHDFAIWEKRVDALVILAGLKGVFSVDGLRRVLEDMGAESFETMSYYERWVASLNQNLLEAGVYSVAELGRAHGARAGPRRDLRRGLRWRRLSQARACGCASGSPAPDTCARPPTCAARSAWWSGCSGRSATPSSSPTATRPTACRSTACASAWPTSGASPERPEDTLDAEIYAHWLETD